MTTDARDKAVEEALENLAGVYMNDSRPPFPEECRSSDRITLNLLWQRAQEAERAAIKELVRESHCCGKLNEGDRTRQMILRLIDERSKA